MFTWDLWKFHFRCSDFVCVNFNSNIHFLDASCFFASRCFTWSLHLIYWRNIVQTKWFPSLMFDVNFTNDGMLCIFPKPWDSNNNWVSLQYRSPFLSDGWVWGGWHKSVIWEHLLIVLLAFPLLIMIEWFFKFECMELIMVEWFFQFPFYLKNREDGRWAMGLGCV